MGNGGKSALAAAEVLPDAFALPLPSTRKGPLFNAHSYPTKIDPAAAMACILVHTSPGDLVFDGFAGSGVTGLAATICGTEPADQTVLPDSLNGVEWGERDCVLYDLSPLAAFIAETLLNPPDPALFESAALAVLASLQKELGWIYYAEDIDGELGIIRHVVWSDVISCRHCGWQQSFGDSSVRLSPPMILRESECLNCGRPFDPGRAGRVLESYTDDLVNSDRMRRRRVPFLIYGLSGSRTWKRVAGPGDRALFDRVAAEVSPSRVPIARMMHQTSQRWGELHRSGYHEGISYVHDFYTRRNLIAVSRAWASAESMDSEVRDALRLWISSYNSAHSTLMTRVVCKKGNDDFVVTSAQPGALYVSSLPVEKNVFRGLARKITVLKEAFKQMRGRKNRIRVECASSLRTNLKDESVDYIFTDPPFGDNIQYSEVNFIAEAWLGRFTDAAEEAIVSSHQGKGLGDYELLLKEAFREAYRILKPGSYATVAFHSTKPSVWEAFRRAWETVGFQLAGTSVLDKTQTSFKQTTTRGAAHKDPLLLLQKPLNPHQQELPSLDPFDPWDLVSHRLEEIAKCGEPKAMRSRQHLYSYVVRRALEQRHPIPLSAQEFYRELDERFQENDGAYFAKSPNEFPEYKLL